LCGGAGNAVVGGRAAWACVSAETGEDAGGLIAGNETDGGLMPGRAPVWRDTVEDSAEGGGSVTGGSEMEAVLLLGTLEDSAEAGGGVTGGNEMEAVRLPRITPLWRLASEGGVEVTGGNEIEVVLLFRITPL
jgi:hypothetical protein